MKIKNKNISKKAIIFIILIIFVIVIVSIGIPLIVFFNRYNNDEYKEYENKMQLYGLNGLYENSSANSLDTVNNMEIIKMVLGSSLNITDISKEIIVIDNRSDNDRWLEKAKKYKFLTDDEISKIILEDKAIIFTLLDYIERSKLFILDKTSGYMSDKNIDTLKQTLIDEGIVTVNETDRINKKLYKGDVNKIICNFVEKYSTLVATDGNILKDPKELPNNYTDYPYVIDSVAKEVYEQPFGSEEDKKVVNYAIPIDLYESKADIFPQIKQYVEKYYNTILNVDYRTIDVNSFYNNLLSVSVMFLNGNKEALKYVEYVKANEIVLKGNVSFQEPCIYRVGYSTMVRVKLEFEIINSKTNENILFYDLESTGKKIYKDSKYTLYIDSPMQLKLNSEYLFNTQNCIYNLLLELSKNKIGFEKVGDTNE